MEITKPNEQCLVVHDGAWGARGLGAVVALIGIGALALVFDGHSHEHNAWVAIVVGLAFAAIGIAMELDAADRRVVIDRAAGSVTMVWRRLFGTTRRVLPLDSIADLALERQPAADSAQRQQWVYRMTFVMRDGSRVPWSHVLTGDYGTQAACVATVRSFLGLEDAGQPTTVIRPASTAGGRNAAIVVLALPMVFVVIGAWMLGEEAYRLATWRPVTATMVISGYVTSKGQHGMLSYRPAFEYKYGPPDAPTFAYGATLLKLSASQDWAMAIINQHPQGSTVTAYIDPGDATRGFVDRRVMWFPLMFMTIPVGIIFLVWNVARWNRKQAMLAPPMGVTVL